MLKIRSPNARQTLTLPCEGVAPSSMEEIKLYADNEVELSISNSHATFGIVENNCQVINLQRLFYGARYHLYTSVLLTGKYGPFTQSMLGRIVCLMPVIFKICSAS